METLSSNGTEFGQRFGRVLRTPLRPQTYRNLAYLLAMFPLGVGYSILLTAGFLTGVSLVPVGVGVLLVLALLVAVVELADLERRLAGWLLGVDIPAPPAQADGSLRTRCKRLVTARGTWKAVAYLLSVFVYGSLAFGLLAAAVATAASFILAPLYFTRAPVTAYGPVPTTEFTLDVLFGWDSLLVGLTTTYRLGSWQVEGLVGALGFTGLGVVVLMGTLLFANAAARLWGHYARRMLTTPRYW